MSNTRSHQPRSRHHNPEGMRQDLLVAGIAAVLLAVGFSGAPIPGATVLALLFAFVALCWIAIRPLSAHVGTDGSVQFETPFYSVRVRPGQFSYRWLSHPNTAHGLILIRMKPWLICYRPEAFTDSAVLAGAVQQLMSDEMQSAASSSANTPPSQRDGERADRMAANLAADSANSDSAVEPATSPQPAKTRTEPPT